MNVCYYNIFGHNPADDEVEKYSQILQQFGPGELNKRLMQDNLDTQIHKLCIFSKTDRYKEFNEVQVKNMLEGRTLLIVGLVRNISHSLNHVKALIGDLRKYFKTVYFYFYHNNSSDNSVALLQQWMLDDPDVRGTFATDTTITVINAITNRIGNRIPMFAQMRNQNLTDALEHFDKKNIDYVCMANTDLVEEIDVQGIVKSFGLKADWSIICGNCCFQKSYYHYDAFALRLLNEPDDIRKIYPNFDRYYGKNSLWLNRLHMFDDWTQVKSGFGDICLIKMDALRSLPFTTLCQVNENEPHICELISMCTRIPGSIFVSPYLTYPATASLEGEVYSPPVCFVPRDAGFFSVFNFLIGTIATGSRVYPYYNKQMFNTKNEFNKHFCYFSKEQENAWFEYFEPLTFYKGDTEHESQIFLSYNTTYGHFAGKEFRSHLEIPALFFSDKFAAWRHNIHRIFTKYIKVQRPILECVNDFWTTTFKNRPDVIGVHYRHPSHFVESGKLFIRDYRKAIDAILISNPNAKIFLSTDSEFGVMVFKSIYNDRVSVFPDICRLEIDNILEWGFAKNTSYTTTHEKDDFVNGKGYQLHYVGAEDQQKSTNQTGVKLGQDIIKETLSLARCRWLVHSISNIALAVSYINPDVQMCLILGK